MLIGIERMAEMLYAIRSQKGGEPQLQFSYSDGRVFWQEFHACSTSAPSLNVGQSANCRWPLVNGSALHAQWFNDRQVVRFHIDDVNPERSGVDHLLHDTHIGTGVILGALLGLFTGKWQGVAAGAALGGVGGAALTTASATVYQVQRIFHDSSFEYSRVLGGSLPVVA